MTDENGKKQEIHLEKPEHLQEMLVPYGVVQPDRMRGGYILMDPPGESTTARKINYSQLDGQLDIVHGKLRVGDIPVTVTPNLQGDDLHYVIGEDGMTVYIQGVYYFNTYEGMPCAIETWDYWFNFMDLHLIRKRGTQGRELGGPYEAGLQRCAVQSAGRPLSDAGRQQR